jgi:hypothetical protein
MCITEDIITLFRNIREIYLCDLQNRENKTKKAVHFKAERTVSEDRERFNSNLPRYIPTLSYCKAV